MRYEDMLGSIEKGECNASWMSVHSLQSTVNSLVSGLVDRHVTERLLAMTMEVDRHVAERLLAMTRWKSIATSWKVSSRWRDGSGLPRRGNPPTSRGNPPTSRGKPPTSRGKPPRNDGGNAMIWG